MMIEMMTMMWRSSPTAAAAAAEAAADSLLTSLAMIKMSTRAYCANISRIYVYRSCLLAAHFMQRRWRRSKMAKWMWLSESSVCLCVYVSLWVSVSVGAVGGGLCGWDYLDGCLHEDIGGIVDTLGAQLQHCRVAPLLGLVHILVDLLQREKNNKNGTEERCINMSVRSVCCPPVRGASTSDARTCDTAWSCPLWRARGAKRPGPPLSHSRKVSRRRRCPWMFQCRWKMQRQSSTSSI